MTAKTARERVREEMTREILDVARHHLAEQGPAALSLRAVARDVGMVSSAVYRYFPSRDDLLTALIIEAYSAVADALESADAAAHRRHTLGRWIAVTTALRTWALAHPHEYALVYGTPVPGYRAPQETIEPVERIARVVFTIVRDGIERGEVTSDDDVGTPRKVQQAMAPVIEFGALPPAVVARGLLAWTAVFGLLSYELFGHLHGVVDDFDAFFEHEVERLGRQVIGTT